jgi:hypothetical protein
MRQRTTVRLPQDLLDRAKRKAVVEGRSLTSMIEEGLRLVIAMNRKGTTRQRVMPRVSEAGGGLMPGLELTQSSMLQEFDDLDYVRLMNRLK